MIAFVKEAEALMEKGQLDRLKNEEGERNASAVEMTVCEGLEMEQNRAASHTQNSLLRFHDKGKLCISPKTKPCHFKC